MQPAYKRVVIKISGEALAGENGFGISGETISKVAEQIISVVKLGVEVGIVIGAGNIWRGRQGRDMDRSTADHMGMLARSEEHTSDSSHYQQSRMPSSA